ncbi:MAG: NapC/NirT family cytochrome c [Actinomycetota bacterium]|jgi:nitrate/TMAO reductase-like tetraheme cytochrome c subunit|nr:NapC/NirT family cytochrome c [Actinomycetota bacterium]
MTVTRRTRVGIGVAVVLLLLVVVPSMIAARPSFFDRYPDLSDEYGPWSESTHVEAGCEGCHVPPNVLSRTVYHMRMAGEFYLSIVWSSRVPNVFDAPENEACLECHSDLRSVSPKGDLQIPHRAHVTVLEMDCIECHNYLVHQESPAGGHAPSMTECLSCHDGDRAKDSCSSCHTEKAAPETHATQAWLIDHADSAADPECITCHKWSDDWCVECHTHRPVSHGTDWRAVHGLRVQEHRSCEACHESEFCVRCHGNVPALNFDPALKLVE